MNYDNDIKLILEKDILNKSEIFDYRDTPQEDIFDNFYQFCREHLDNNLVTHNINPTAFIYTNELAANAKAKYSNDTFSIHINIGLFRKCVDDYLNNENLDNFIEKHYSALIEKFDNKMSTLAFQVSTQFTFYHEFAHLIQFSKRREELTLQERYSKDSEYDEIKHYLEVNADSHSAISIATHIQQYIRKCYGEDINQENVEFTITLLCSCLLNYIATFCDDVSEIYFKKYTHPHPFLRLFAVNLNIIEYLNQSPYLKEKNIKINTNELFQRVLDLYQKLEANDVFQTKISAAMEEGSKNKKEIVEHLGSLVEMNIENYKDAIKEWNK